MTIFFNFMPFAKTVCWCYRGSIKLQQPIRDVALLSEITEDIGLFYSYDLLFYNLIIIAEV